MQVEQSSSIGNKIIEEKETQIKKEIAMEKKYSQYARSSRVSVGVGVHKVSWSVTILEEGELVKQCTLAGEADRLRSAYRKAY